MTPIEFDGSPSPTLGVEWEFALTDKVTGDLSNSAAALFAAVEEHHPERLGKIHKELLRNTVELVTGICRTTGEAVADLTDTLGIVRVLTEELGVDLYGAGTHPFAEYSTQLLTEGHRYAELIERTQWWGRQMLIWGVHVHVGISHRDKVLPILDALLNYYPHLLALSSSSPMWAGQDTGYASNRAMMFQQLPTAGLPFQFETWEQFEAFVADQKTTGIIDHLNEIRWDIRPSPHLGTIEVRVCDGMTNLGELSAIVALIHCLVVDLDRRFSAGETLPTMAPWLVQENKWRAARYGLEAIVILDADCTERLVTEDLHDLLERLQPIARDLDCVDELAGIENIIAQGASYQRQRAVYRDTHSMRDVVASVVAELGG
ncbi:MULTISPECIES: glutamate--cysteine ligase [Gordonia]|uniref:Putative glutamate--cysteine ligase 2 n=1 Tax=Gordonia amicalis TaxID=89053 RepID=A0ABU4DE11_9ACTN|nr:MULTISPECIES: glutamate--cysteine ligase [Gordonia]ATD69345.1 glutamate--cysteine ligase [Gordonia sp. 1D]KAF0971142.1 putative glutamate--cysteine ligase 2 [Gordonia sp. YY1]MCR8898329.1 glutamate--cysteine ligase [Gordonia sp. GONU]MCZ0911322.1 glutamate--cysteine ligase [Gordonia amicalis]MDJ0451934.1 glutamate--cysteine ligase [Gordonia amicalis]